jgi:hypothetical protein
LIGLVLVLIVFLGTTSCSKKDDSTNNETENANVATPSPTTEVEPSPTQTEAIPKPTRPTILVPKLPPRFGGNWRTVDQSTRGITRLVIRQNLGRFSVSAFERCKDKECLFGTARGSVTGDEGHVTFVKSGAKLKMVFKLQGELLQASLDSFFPDGKQATHLDQTFRKQ